MAWLPAAAAPSAAVSCALAVEGGALPAAELIGRGSFEPLLLLLPDAAGLEEAA